MMLCCEVQVAPCDGLTASLAFSGAVCWVPGGAGPSLWALLEAWSQPSRVLTSSASLVTGFSGSWLPYLKLGLILSTSETWQELRIALIGLAQ